MRFRLHFLLWGGALYASTTASLAAIDALVHHETRVYGSTDIDQVNAVAVGYADFVGVVGAYGGVFRDRANTQLFGSHAGDLGTFAILRNSNDDTPSHRWTASLPPLSANGDVNGWAMAIEHDLGAVSGDIPGVAIGGDWTYTADFLGEDFTAQTAASADGFIIRVVPLGSSTWRVNCSSDGHDSVHGLHFSPSSLVRDPVPPREPLDESAETYPALSHAGTFVAAVGEFAQEMGIESDSTQVGATLTANGGQDAFIVLLDSADGTPLDAISVGGGGTYDDCANAVYVDRFQAVYVTGYFQGQDVEFNPNGDTFDSFKVDSGGGKDLFVAKYRYPEGPNTLQLDWFWHTDLSGDEEGLAITVATDGTTFVTGYSQQGITQDIFIAAFPPDDKNWANFNPPIWTRTIGSNRGESGTGISLDGLERVHVTGYFGRYRQPSHTDPNNCPSCEQYTLDFDPLGDGDEHTTVSGQDVFLTRLKRDGSYDGTVTFGGDWNDVGRAIAIEQDYHRVHHGGYFGDAGAAAGYQIDFDPASGSSDNPPNRGGRDAFWNRLQRPFDEVTAMISLVIDTSDSVYDQTCSETGERLFTEIINAYANLIQDELIVRHDGSTALSAVYFGGPSPGGSAYVAVPWTVIDSSSTANAFAAAMRAAPPVTGRTAIGKGMVTSTESFADSILTVVDGDAGGLWPKARVMNVFAEGKDNVSGSNPSNARDDALDSDDGPVDQINGLALLDDSQPPPSDPLTEQYFIDNIIGNNASWAYAADHSPFVLSDYNACPPSLGQPSDLQRVQALKFICEIYHCSYDFVNDDCTVGQAELGILLATYELPPDDPDYNPLADLDNDGDVDQSDLAILLSYYDCGTGGWSP